VAAVGGRLRARFPALSSLSLSLSALAALGNAEVRQLADGVGAYGSTLTSFSLHNEESGKYDPPSFFCFCCGRSYRDILDELRIAHPSTLALRLTTLLSGMPGLATLDLRGLADLAGPDESSVYYCDCVSAFQRGYADVFHVYSLLGAFTGRLRSLSLACDYLGSGLGLLAASVDALAPSLRHLSITAAAPDDEDGDSDTDDGGPWLDEGETAFLGRLTALQTLALRGCRYNLLPEWLASLTRLTRLEANGCCLSFEEDAAALAGLPRLRELTLQEFAPEEEGLGPVAGVTRLTCETNWAERDALLAAFPGLLEAELHIFALGPAAAPAPAVPLGEHLRRLTARIHLPLAGAPGIGAFRGRVLENLRQLLLGLPTLRQLHIHAEGSIAGAELPPLLRASPALEELTLSGDLSTLDASAFAVCPRYPSLRALSLDDDGGRCGESKKPPEQALAGLTPAGLLALGRAFPGLARLSLGEGVSLERRRAWWRELRHAAATGSCSDASLLRAVRRVLRHGAAHSVARAARKAA